MGPERLITLVQGYVPGVDRLPGQARRSAFSSRFAVVFETFRPDQVDMVFDVELYASLLYGIPEPYHDSYTVAFFADEATIATIERAARAVLSEQGIVDVAVVRADAQPQR